MSEVIDAFLILTRTEGIIPALESAHAIAHAIKISKKMKKTESIVVTLSGRGDKGHRYCKGVFEPKMSRIKEKFNQLKSKRETALISYIMAGYPSEKTTLAAVRGLIQGGCRYYRARFFHFQIQLQMDQQFRWQVQNH